ncbi:MAG: YitT family protein [Desulfobacteraceae bacterium]|jgi:uncharacterized membrane-anchored protein YitT (DUF2179 family)
MDKIFAIGKMLAGTLIMAVGINFFLRPAAIFAGGSPGMAVIFLHMIGTEYTHFFGLIIFCFQALFICIQLPFSGVKKTIKGVVTSIMFAIMTQLTIASARDIHISDNILLMSVGGSLFLGLGVSLVLISGFRFVGTLGIAEIVTEKTGIPPGKSVLYIESVVLLTGVFVIGMEQAMVSVIGLYVLSKTINSVTYGMYQYKQLQIISHALADIRQVLDMEISPHSSIVKAENDFTGDNPDMLVLFIRYDQYKKVKDIIRRYDPNAFVAVADVNDLLGKGFRRL